MRSDFINLKLTAFVFLFKLAHVCISEIAVTKIFTLRVLGVEAISSSVDGVLDAHSGYKWCTRKLVTKMRWPTFVMRNGQVIYEQNAQPEVMALR